MEAVKIEHSTIMQANIQRVWKALTTDKHFSKWFGGKIEFPKVAVGEKIFMDLGEYGEGDAIITAVEPPTHFAFKWTAETGYDIRTLVTFRLEAMGESTRVTVTEEGFEALPENLRLPRFTSNNEGWSIQLKNLTDFLRENENVAL